MPSIVASPSDARHAYYGSGAGGLRVRLDRRCGFAEITGAGLARSPVPPAAQRASLAQAGSGVGAGAL
jgi:hypothetical protein